MPLFYRIFVEERTEDETQSWVKFESVLLYSFLATTKKAIGKGTPGGDSLENETLAGHTLLAIAHHKHFYVEVGPDEIDMHTVHYLLAAIQQKWKLNMQIDLVKFDKGGRQAGIAVVAEEFVAQVLSSIMRGKDYYAFNFQITGGVTETEL